MQVISKRRSPASADAQDPRFPVEMSRGEEHSARAFVAHLNGGVPCGGGLLLLLLRRGPGIQRLRAAGAERAQAGVARVEGEGDLGRVAGLDDNFAPVDPFVFVEQLDGDAFGARAAVFDAGFELERFAEERFIGRSIESGGKPAGGPGAADADDGDRDTSSRQCLAASTGRVRAAGYRR